MMKLPNGWSIRPHKHMQGAWSVYDDTGQCVDWHGAEGFMRMFASAMNGHRWQESSYNADLNAKPGIQETPPFTVGDIVEKVSGAAYDRGEVRSVFKNQAGEFRVMVENPWHQLHVYSPSQLRPWDGVKRHG